VQVPALTFLNGEKDGGRGGWPLYGMEVGEILKSLSCKSRTVERSLVTGGRRRRGGDTAAMYLLSGVDMTATGFVPVAYREHGPCIDSLARNTNQTDWSYSRSRTNAIAKTREWCMKPGSTDLHTTDKAGVMNAGDNKLTAGRQRVTSGG
jgi:hypothetical protein